MTSTDATTEDTAPPSDRLAVWRAFLETHAAVVDVLEHELRTERDLPLTWYDVLVQLSEAQDHQLRMQDLAQAVLLSKSGLTRLVDRMERAGLVIREPCERDRRGTFARLTDAGLERLRACAPVHLRGVAQHFTSHLTDDEVATLAAAFDRILAASGAARRS